MPDPFDPDYMLFVKWQATPAEFSENPDTFPRTMQAFADSIGKSRQTLYDWQKKEGHWDRVKEAYNSLHARKAIAVRDALYQRTQGVEVVHLEKGKPIYKELPPDPKSIELWLKYEDKWQPVEKTESKLTVSTESDELAKALKNALDK